MKDHLCTGCGEPHIVQDAHKESLTKIKCNMLKQAAAHVMATGVNDFKKNDFPGTQSHSEYANFPKLRYHGLIARSKADGVTHRDRWLITRNGWAFLRGELELPKYIRVRYNRTLEEGRSDTLVSLLDVLKGGEYMETTFEYFDEETGAMIGRRPITRPGTQQTTLLDMPPERKRSFA